MKNSNLKLVWKAMGYLDAQMVKNLLLSFEIDSIMYEESVGQAYGLTFTPLGEVEIYVAKKDYENAYAIIDEYYS